MRAGARRPWPMSSAILREHPDAIIPDISQPDPVFTFTKDDVALVYGSSWKQRYFKKVGDDYFPLPVQWDVIAQKMEPYFVPKAPIGGRPCIRRTISSGPPDRSATVATR